MSIIINRKRLSIAYSSDNVKKTTIANNQTAKSIHQGNSLIWDKTTLHRSGHHLQLHISFSGTTSNQEIELKLDLVPMNQIVSITVVAGQPAEWTNRISKRKRPNKRRLSNSRQRVLHTLTLKKIGPYLSKLWYCYLFRLQVRSFTWHRDSHGLFDYESKNVTQNFIKCNYSSNNSLLSVYYCFSSTDTVREWDTLWGDESVAGKHITANWKWRAEYGGCYIWKGYQLLAVS